MNFQILLEGTMVVRTALDDVYREIDIIRNLNHPHVLKVHEILIAKSVTSYI